jgi:hypothetical protein
VLLVRSYFKQFVNTRLSRNMRNSFRGFFFLEKDSHDIPNATRFINAKYIFIANSRSSKRKIDYLSLGLLPPPARASFPDHATPDTFAHRVDPAPHHTRLPLASPDPPRKVSGCSKNPSGLARSQPWDLAGIEVVAATRRSCCWWSHGIPTTTPGRRAGTVA